MTWHRKWLSSARTWLSGRPRVLVGAISLMALVLVAASGSVAWFAHDVTAGLPTASQVRGLGEMAQSTTIFDANDTPAFTIFKEQRIEIPFERMSPNLIKAVVSVEDQRFYEHNGVDFIRVAAAAVRNLQERRRAEGGSTITQQLARQTFLSRDKTYRRKLKEVILAAHIEREYSKKDILEMYLNKVYFGDGLYGVEAASRGYFGKHASDLTVDEAALLAGLIQSPSSYAPTVNLDRAIARRNVVLQTMVSTGAIDQAQYERAKQRGGHAEQRPRDEGVLRPLLQGERPQGARRAFRGVARGRGRAPRVHDDGSRASAGGREGGRGRRVGHRASPRLSAPRP